MSARRPLDRPAVALARGSSRPQDVVRAGIAGRGLAFLVAVGVCGAGATAQTLTRPVYRVDRRPSPLAQAQPVATRPSAANPHQVQPVQPAFRWGSVQPGAAPLGEAMPSGEAIEPSIERPAWAGGVRPASAEEPASPFDLEQRPGEHPLMPCIRLAKQALVDIDQNLQDYSATFTKVERVGGKLNPPAQLQIRVRHSPFSVYMRFVTPTPGQEALYVADQNNGKLVAMGTGWQRRLGKFNLDPDGAMAMRNQKYPITKAGIRNLTAELVQKAEADTKYAECEVRYDHGVKVAGRPASMIEVIHPVPRKNFSFHIARIFIDHEMRLPVAYEAYTWPKSEGEKPVLEERYIYTDLKLNNGFTDADFSAENPAMFN